MSRLSLPLTEIKDHYTVVVVGSGYGGSISASRLARAGQAVCMLERGKEFRPGEYPDTLTHAAHEAQVDGPEGHVGSRTGLYDFRVNPDINVFMGCGLGGTSLVNANVSLRAEPRVFEDERWPAAFRADAERLEEGYRHAEAMLKPVPYPDDQPELPKMEAQRLSAGALGEPFELTPINVNFSVDGPNHVGEVQHPCALCGDCVSGCNYGAKNTTLMNYLPDAVNHGAEIFTQVSVRRIEHQGGRWLVHYQPVHTGREAFDAPTLFVSADIVILGAGTLGSTEILLRSRAAGLPVSDHLGKGLTGNGDVLGFGFDTGHEIRGIGYGHRTPERMDPVGPCITSVINARNKPDLEHGMVIEEGVVPGALGAMVPGALEIMGAAVGKATDHNLLRQVRSKVRELQSMLLGAYRGAARNTQTYLIMTHDDAGGELYLEKDRLRISWPGVGEQESYVRANDSLLAATKALGGTYIKNPTWTKLLKHNLVTVHPLGCCVMAEDATAGVVNHKGQVFSGTTGEDIHEGLYVADGSVIPRSLGVNPLLTISAVAERTCALLAEDRGWTISYDLPSAPRTERAATKPGIQFTETMRGFVALGETGDYAEAEIRGKSANSTFEFTLTITSTDVDAMLSDPAHSAGMVGTAVAPGLSQDPMTVTDGTFQLFVGDSDGVDARRMVYRMTLNTTDGKAFGFEGYKEVQNAVGKADLWPDTSTLYITVRESPDEAAGVLGKGILHIRPADFLKQMTTMQAPGARTRRERLQAMVKFGQFFAGELYDVYGGVLGRAHVLNPDAPPRQKRPLRMDAPEIHTVTTADGAALRLTRYQGGEKGPVILAPGFGTSGAAYLIDTVETNLPELLYANGYDVLVFDYRASPALPSAETQFTVDEIATQDWPAAVAATREIAAADTVQVVGHCVGSMSFLMAKLAGLEGVRSMVSSQLTTHPDSPALTRAKADMHLGNLILGAGVKLMSTDYDPGSQVEKLFDGFMRLYPSKEPCRSPVCRRILFMYGEVYKHDLLNAATHDAVHEMFGVANFSTLTHITTMIRKGHVVDKDGNDVYMPHLDRLNMPIAFIHGEQNRMFLPSGSEKAFRTLREANGGDNYVRHVIPGYGHMDCFIGRDAARDVFPVILTELDQWN